MLSLEQIKNFFPLNIQENPVYHKYMLKEYIQLLILDYLATTSYIRKINFIGGTCLRLVKGIDRFSEDIDFDCKKMLNHEFTEMTDSILQFLLNSGMKVETQDKPKDKLTAFRRSYYFPRLLYDMGLSSHKEERFKIKVECQDQEIEYHHKMVNIKGCGLFFPFPVPGDDVLCAMKISALLSRQKGRDFYDVMFLLPQSQPSFTFLTKSAGINNHAELMTSVKDLLNRIDLKHKAKDFEHLLFNKEYSRRILAFGEFITEMAKDEKWKI